MDESIANNPKSTIYKADPDWKGVYQTGGLAMIVAGLLYLIGSTCGIILGVPPANSQAYLQSLADKPALAMVTYWIFGLAVILLLPGMLGLYHALKGINKSAMLIAAGLTITFIILDLGVTELTSLALVSLTQNYASAASDAQRTAYLAAANWGLAIIPFATFLSYAGPSSGWLIASIIMLKGIFGNFTARLGIIVNILGILIAFYFLFPVPVLGIFLTPILVLYGVWLIAAGRRLYRLGK
jgi:hypothetical protein